MKTIRKTFISACLLSLIFIFAAFAPIGVKAADATIYDISDIVEKIGARKEYEMKHGVKEVSGTALGYGDTVKFAYKERSDKNTDGHYSRTAFGIGSYGFYFYHTSGDIQVRICNMQTDARNWDRSNSYFDTIPDNTFRTYGEITFTAALKTGDENTVVLTLVYPGGKVSKEFAKQDSSDMLFRFGDHDVDGNFVKSLAPKTDNENPVITVLVDEFRVPVGSYPAADAFTATDNSGSCTVTLTLSAGAQDSLGRLTAGRHTCTITAEDDCENIATATITYIVTADEPQTLYKITFVADGKTVAEVSYCSDEAEYIAAPDVPQKDYYDGRWELYTPDMTETQTVRAVYTPKTYTVIFVADNEIVSEQYYTDENNPRPQPQGPQHDGYTGVWESYELNFTNIRVKAKYTKTATPDPDPTPITPEEPDNTGDDGKSGGKNGCGGSIGGIYGMVALCAAALLVKKKNG